MFNITAPHWHLLINHLPVVGIMASVLLLIWGLIRNSAELKRTALLTFVLVGILAFVANWTGDGASGVVRDIPGVNRQDIREHSSAADIATYISMGLAGIALIGLIGTWRKKEDTGVSTENYIRHHKEPHKAFIIICLIVGLIDIYVLAWTANLGGEIRHPEIRAGFQVPAKLPADTTEE